jgi:hypothetical protein
MFWVCNKYKTQKWGNSILLWQSLSIFLDWVSIHNQVYVFYTFWANLSFFSEKSAEFRRWTPADRLDTTFLLVLNYTKPNNSLFDCQISHPKNIYCFEKLWKMFRMRGSYFEPNPSTSKQWITKPNDTIFSQIIFFKNLKFMLILILYQWQIWFKS